MQAQTVSTTSSNIPESGVLPVPVEGAPRPDIRSVEETKTVASRSLSEPQHLAAPIPGYANYTPEQQYAFNKWLETTKAVYAKNGFSYLHLRPFERKAALWGEGDTQKQIFGVTRLNAEESETEIAIPYDRTVPFALWVANHGHELPLPYKRQDVSLSCRGERQQAGRFRAFIQADVDVVGRKLGLDSDVDCLATLITALQSLQMGLPFTFAINHLSVVKAMVRASQIPDECQPEVFRLIDKLDKHPQEEITDLISQIENIGVDRPVIEGMVKKFAERGSVESFAFDRDYGPEATQGLDDLQTMIKLLKAAGVDTSCIQFAPGMVRGLAYYTGLVFETTIDGKEHYGSICGGGRYDNLVGSFNDKFADIGGVGGSIGLTRLFDIMVREGMPMPKRTTIADVLVGYRTQEQQAYAYGIVGRLRSLGIPTDLSFPRGGVRSFYTYADKIGVPVSICAMDESSFVVKDMQRSVADRDYRGFDLKSIDSAVEEALVLMKI